MIDPEFMWQYHQRNPSEPIDYAPLGRMVLAFLIRKKRTLKNKLEKNMKVIFAIAIACLYVALIFFALNARSISKRVKPHLPKIVPLGRATLEDRDLPLTFEEVVPAGVLIKKGEIQ